MATVMIGSPAAIAMSGFTMWLPESTWICEFAAIEDCSVIVSDPSRGRNRERGSVEQHRTERYRLVQRDVEGEGEIEPVLTLSSNQALAVGRWEPPTPGASLVPIATMLQLTPSLLPGPTA